MTEENGHDHVPVESDNGKVLFGGEPFHKAAGHDDGSVRLPGNGYHADARSQIKNRTDAPHMAVIMPIGNKTESVVKDDGKTRTVIDQYRQPGLVPVELMLNTMQVMQPLNITMSWVVMKNDLSARLREQMTEQALERGCNYLFYWDDDVLIPNMTWYRMLNFMNRYPDIGAITGVVWTRAVPTEPILYKDGGAGAYWGFSTNPEDGPEDVYAAGAGCLMARADAVRKMERPWWHDEKTGSASGGYQGVIGHDLRFCRNMKNQTGYRVTVDGSLQCHHFDVAEQKVFKIPDTMPEMSKARDAADGYVNLDRALEHKGAVKMDDILEAVAE
jgi:hypothetical protein